MSAIVQAARELGELIEAHADEAERERRLPMALVERLRDAGLLRMCVPKAYGGPECDPITILRAIESVATADGAAGWCTMIASTTSSLSMFLPPASAKELFADPPRRAPLRRRRSTGSVGCHCPTSSGQRPPIRRQPAAQCRSGRTRHR